MRGLHKAPPPVPASLYVSWVVVGLCVVMLSGWSRALWAQASVNLDDFLGAPFAAFTNASAASSEEAADVESGAGDIKNADMLEAISSIDVQAQHQIEEEARLEELQAPVDYNANVKELLQNPDLAGGCEVASMLAVLRAMGYTPDSHDFVDNYLMNIEGEKDMVHGYSGSPYSRGAAFPPIMVQAGNAYLEKEGSIWRFVERKNNAFSRLLSVVETGRPVLVWTTMGMVAPEKTETVVEGYHWYTNEHCVVLYGTKDGKLLIMDPLEGVVERDAAEFEKIYTDCGSMAVALSRWAR